MTEIEQLKLRIAQLEKELVEQDLNHRAECTHLRDAEKYQIALIRNAVVEQFNEDLGLVICMLDRPSPKIPQAINRIEWLQIVAAELLRKSTIGKANRHK